MITKDKIQCAVQALELIEHKLDQHLQGQYNNPPYPALGSALETARLALTVLKEDTQSD